ncbi:MAG TPA: hypothetical protein VNT75_25210 [Symbiobacteriaceae bacterium]|nr:hypothetical protein [Symbiobacteriaceae bacterium]
MEPVIYMPTEAATATSPEGRRMVFFRVPQLELMIKQVIAARPDQYTYSWGYHPGHKVHVLMFQWPTGQGAGIAIPEGAGDMILTYMLGTTTVYITTEPVQDVLSGNVSGEQVQKIVLGNTAGLTEVKFKPEA